MKFCTSSFASVSLFASASDSVMTFRSQPVSWLARRMFWPPRPMACDSFSSATAISMLCESSSTTIDITSAGDIALMTNCAGLSSYGMMSTRSPAISFETACTREPRMPTHAPTGSMRGSLLRTAILARTPASRAAPRIWIRPWPTSGTSSLNSSIRNSGAVRRQEQLRAARLGAHFLQEGLDAVLRLHLLARNHVRARHEAFGVAAEIDVDAVAVDALDDAAHQRADAILVGIDHLRALGLAHLLHDDLLGLLGGDAAEGHRLHRLLDEAADLDVRVEVASRHPGAARAPALPARWSRRRTPSSGGTSRSRRSCGRSATRTSHSSPCFLRVAEASAASSASKITSLSTPFSFETASTTIRISLFTLSYLRTRSRVLRREPRFADLRRTARLTVCRSTSSSIPPPSTDAAVPV